MGTVANPKQLDSTNEKMGEQKHTPTPMPNFNPRPEINWTEMLIACIHAITPIAARVTDPESPEGATAIHAAAGDVLTTLIHAWEIPAPSTRKPS
jgi:hypothetical protein